MNNHTISRDESKNGEKTGVVFRTMSNIYDEAFLQKELIKNHYFCKNTPSLIFERGL